MELDRGGAAAPPTRAELHTALASPEVRASVKSQLQERGRGRWKSFYGATIDMTTVAIAVAKNCIVHNNKNEQRTPEHVVDAIFSELVGDDEDEDDEDGDGARAGEPRLPRFTLTNLPRTLLVDGNQQDVLKLKDLLVKETKRFRLVSEPVDLLRPTGGGAGGDDNDDGGDDAGNDRARAEHLLAALQIPAGLNAEQARKNPRAFLDVLLPFLDQTIEALEDDYLKDYTAAPVRILKELKHEAQLAKQRFESEQAMRTVLVGDNGIGKSTFINTAMIVSERPPEDAQATVSERRWEALADLERILPGAAAMFRDRVEFVGEQGLPVDEIKLDDNYLDFLQKAHAATVPRVDYSPLLPVAGTEMDSTTAVCTEIAYGRVYHGMVVFKTWDDLIDIVEYYKTEYGKANAARQIEISNCLSNGILRTREDVIPGQSVRDVGVVFVHAEKLLEYVTSDDSDEMADSAASNHGGVDRDLYALTPEAASLVNRRVRLFSGTGARPQLDRLFVRDTLLQLAKDPTSKFVVKGLYVYVPSALLEAGQRWIDGPGLNDADAIKEANTNTAVAAATSVLIFLKKTLSASKSTNSFVNTFLVTPAANAVVDGLLQADGGARPGDAVGVGNKPKAFHIVGQMELESVGPVLTPATADGPQALLPDATQRAMAAANDWAHRARDDLQRLFRQCARGQRSLTSEQQRMVVSTCMRGVQFLPVRPLLWGSLMLANERFLISSEPFLQALGLSGGQPLVAALEGLLECGLIAYLPLTNLLLPPGTSAANRLRETVGDVQLVHKDLSDCLQLVLPGKRKTKGFRDMHLTAAIANIHESLKRTDAAIDRIDKAVAVRYLDALPGAHQVAVAIFSDAELLTTLNAAVVGARAAGQQNRPGAQPCLQDWLGDAVVEALTVARHCAAQFVGTMTEAEVAQRLPLPAHMVAPTGLVRSQQAATGLDTLMLALEYLTSLRRAEPVADVSVMWTGIEHLKREMSVFFTQRLDEAAELAFDGGLLPSATVLAQQARTIISDAMYWELRKPKYSNSNRAPWTEQTLKQFCTDVKAHVCDQVDKSLKKSLHDFVTILRRSMTETRKTTMVVMDIHVGLIWEDAARRLTKAERSPHRADAWKVAKAAVHQVANLVAKVGEVMPRADVPTARSAPERAPSGPAAAAAAPRPIAHVRSLQLCAQTHEVDVPERLQLLKPRSIASAGGLPSVPLATIFSSANARDNEQPVGVPHLSWRPEEALEVDLDITDPRWTSHARGAYAVQSLVHALFHSAYKLEARRESVLDAKLGAGGNQAMPAAAFFGRLVLQKSLTVLKSADVGIDVVTKLASDRTLAPARTAIRLSAVSRVNGGGGAEHPPTAEAVLSAGDLAEACEHVLRNFCDMNQVCVRLIFRSSLPLGTVESAYFGPSAGSAAGAVYVGLKVLVLKDGVGADVVQPVFWPLRQKSRIGSEDTRVSAIFPPVRVGIASAGRLSPVRSSSPPTTPPRSPPAAGQSSPERGGGGSTGQKRPSSDAASSESSQSARRRR